MLGRLLTHSTSAYCACGIEELGCSPQNFIFLCNLTSDREQTWSLEFLDMIPLHSPGWKTLVFKMIFFSLQSWSPPKQSEHCFFKSHSVFFGLSRKMSAPQVLACKPMYTEPKTDPQRTIQKSAKICSQPPTGQGVRYPSCPSTHKWDPAGHGTSGHRNIRTQEHTP